MRTAAETTEQADLNRDDDSADDDTQVTSENLPGETVVQWDDHTLVVRGTLRIASSNASLVGRACNEHAQNANSDSPWHACPTVTKQARRRGGLDETKTNRAQWEDAGGSNKRELALAGATAFFFFFRSRAFEVAYLAVQEGAKKIRNEMKLV